MRKQKNKAIAGRRNRCHALPQLPVILKVNRDLPKEVLRKFLEEMEAAVWGNHRFSIMPEPEYEIINPNIRKRPRILT